MTTKAAERLYEAQHLLAMKGRRAAIHNPDDAPIETLPVIYGFNNGGPDGWYMAIAIAADGTVLGSHICSSEGYMPHDLGILEGTQPDRHDTFREHYPHGYRMEFVRSENIKAHAGLQEAFRLNKER